MIRRQLEEFTDEELLKEYEWAAEHIPDDSVSQPAPDEFEKVWERIQEESRKGDMVKGRLL